ncbi:Lipase B [Neofusicoccum parvum]|uniref:Lipase B n=1 Tax=Neofusicoccum parvum TaxID=310453 RepID=A0ACB5RRH0_9PEZI|nr:Lipase B [Neofusicoccum parvum]GME51138.1 Lipase B [Neofusicoccum parvum]
MYSRHTWVLAASAYWRASFAAPTPTQPLQDRGLVGELLNPVESLVHGVATGLVGDATAAASVFNDILHDISATVPTNSPADIDEVFTLVQDIFTPTPTDLYENVVDLVANSLSPGDLENVFESYSTGYNSENNNNAREPDSVVYPSASDKDAPYSLSESQLRQAIYIPSGFTYGEKPPVILVPGTGAKGGENFGSNFIPLFTGVDYADPVWLNIPGFLLDDAQVNAEYVAYAINYISGISKNKKVSVLGWSQGNLDIQWANKYWPSTVKNVNKHIAMSPDYHGTQLAKALCPDFPTLPCAPSVLQQEYNSNFVTQLRKNGGDSAYVTTTNVFSVTDEIVQPQAEPGASAHQDDVRDVGVTNNELQSICNGKPAGIFYTHEGVLYNPIAFALAKDTLINDGPGLTSRIDLDGLCQELVTEGLSLTDVVATEGTIAVAAAAILLYPNKLVEEPPLKAYATY